jgi:Mg/Co/Ni transporter MgtE (contains CBS domain)
MLPGWMMPIDELINNVLSAPPQEAARVLTTLPPDRFEPVLQAMRIQDLAHVAISARPEDQAELMSRLSITKIQDLVHAMAPAYAANLLATLTPKRLVAVMEGVAPAETSELLRVMPEEQRTILLNSMDRHNAGSLLASSYELDVAQVLGRTNVTVSSLGEGVTDALLVGIFGRYILLTIHYIDQGEFTAQDLQKAESRAQGMQVSAVLAVTNAQIGYDVPEYKLDAMRRGRLIDVVTWTDPGHDGQLQRMLVQLVR